MASERKVPILRSENSLIEQEFDSIREKFENEMGKMEEEMSRFRSQIIASERDRLASSQNSTMSTLSTSSSRSASTKSSQQQQQQSSKLTASQTSKSSSTSSSSASLSSKQQYQKRTNKLVANPTDSSTCEKFLMDSSSVKWLNEISSPLIKESENGKVLKLRFDVNAYEPEQIFVKTVDNRLQIQARREEKTDSMSMFRSYDREFLLPEGTDPELIRSSLSADGILTVEAPLPAPLLNQC